MMLPLTCCGARGGVHNAGILPCDCVHERALARIHDTKHTNVDARHIAALGWTSWHMAHRCWLLLLGLGLSTQCATAAGVEAPHCACMQPCCMRPCTHSSTHMMHICMSAWRKHQTGQMQMAGYGAHVCVATRQCGMSICYCA